MKQPFRSNQEIVSYYQHHIGVHEAQIEKLKKSKKILSAARLISVILGLGICYYFWPEIRFSVSSVLLFSVIFIFLVFRDTDKTSALKERERQIRINRHEIDALQQNLSAYDEGHSFADPLHPYASDLDLFGPASLFQYLSRCHTDQSKILLAGYLKTPLNSSDIREKQDAAAELSEKQAYCQKFQSTAMTKPLTLQTEEKLKQCIEAPSAGFQNSFWKGLRYIYPVIPLSITAFYIAGDLTDKVFLYCAAVFYLISMMFSWKAKPALDMLLDIEPEIEAVQKLFYLIEKENFRAAFLQSLQNRLKPGGYKSTSDAIGEFLSILKKNDSRANLLVNLVLQIFFLWDLGLVIALNEWKKKNRIQFKDWFHVIAEMEVLNSLASLVHNEPEWVFPEVDDQYFHFSTIEIGHPLIPPNKRITSDFELEGTGKIALITGSNMAGKSTFLRTLGINTVLAGMGSPVCARHLSLSNLTLMSSMRVADNLAENTSTFYAELKKLKSIIEAVNRKERVFILLDEVLRGTNSDDRHKGSQALVRQLLKSESVAVMATHDTELAHSESANESLFNYHFEGKIIADELYFDYKIKKGICESLNATELMKKIGIHFQD